VIHGLALCAGVGGLELGVRQALGRFYRTVGYVERDAYCASVLVARMADASLDPAPLFRDLESFDGEAWCGCVDLITAGFPCQPASVAGKHGGRGDARWVWPAVAECIRRVGPRYVFLENVRGLLSVDRGHAFGEVLGDLADLGFDAEWGVFSASESAGAPHRRERLFVLAKRVSDPERDSLRVESERGSGTASASECGDAGSGELGEDLADARRAESELTAGDGSGSREASGSGSSCKPDGRGEYVADADRGGQQGERVEERGGERGAHGGESHRHGEYRRQPGQAVGDTDWRRRRQLEQGERAEGGALAGGSGEAVGESGCERLQGECAAGSEAGSVGRASLPPFPPGPSSGEWGGILERWPELAPAIEPGLCGLDAGLAPRVERLRAAGNGVCPQQAAVAWTELHRRLSE